MLHSVFYTHHQSMDSYVHHVKTTAFHPMKYSVWLRFIFTVQPLICLVWKWIIWWWCEIFYRWYIAIQCFWKPQAVSLILRGRLGDQCACVSFNVINWAYIVPLQKNHTIKTWCSGGKAQNIFISALDRGKCSTSHSSCFSPRKSACSIH
jgi:hypothetical protein